MKKTMTILFAAGCLMAAAAMMSSCGEEEDELMTRSDTEWTDDTFFDLEPPTDAYDYPVEPGTDKWLKLHAKGLDAVYAALQIPESDLKKMSATELVLSFLKNPYSAMFTASSSSNYMGFLSMVERHPNFKAIYDELKKRDDAARAVIYILKNYDSYDLDFALLKLPVLPFMASEECIYGKLNDSGKRVAVAMALERLNQKPDDLGFYGHPIAFMAGRIMRSVEFKPMMDYINAHSGVSGFLENEMLMEENFTPAILELAANYVK